MPVTRYRYRGAVIPSPWPDGRCFPKGEVVVAGRPTASIATPEEWLAYLDRFGLVNARAVLLDQLTVGQNLAVARTLIAERRENSLPPAPQTEVVSDASA